MHTSLYSVHIETCAGYVRAIAAGIAGGTASYRHCIETWARSETLLLLMTLHFFSLDEQNLGE